MLVGVGWCVCVLVCWLVCAARGGARLPPEPSRVRPCQGFAALETQTNDISTQNPRVQKRALLPPEPEYAPAPEVTTFPRKTHGSKSKSARGYRQSQGFAALETQSDDISTQNPPPELEYAPARVSRWRPKVTTHPRPKARAATARALWSTPLPGFRGPGLK